MTSTSTHTYIQYQSQEHKLFCQGDWVLASFPKLKDDVNDTKVSVQNELLVDGADITSLDSAGAWLLSKKLKTLEKRGLKVQLQNFSEPHQKLLTLIEKDEAANKHIPEYTPMSWVASVGKKAHQGYLETKEFLGFIGNLSVEFVGLVKSPQRIRWNALAGTIGTTGLDALPIIALLSFMIGVVIAYQMGVQLRSYGANIYIVDFLGLSVLREFGPLLTAIMVSGRSGSAFTAQLGTMKINQEIDALDTMGVTPADLLLLPKIIGLVIALPLLTIWADMFGVFGGMIMAKNMLDINFYDFLTRFSANIPLKTLLIGLGKAPIFALIISSIGCFEGVKVERNADSVGKHTTRSVVLAIFFIIVTDAIFSIVLSKMQL